MTQRGSSLCKAKLARQIEELRENGETACDDSNHSRYRLSQLQEEIGMDFAPFLSKNGYRLCPFWSGIGYSFRGSYGGV